MPTAMPVTSDNTTVLITGANRGLGRGFLEVYLSRPSTTVIAAVRDPQAPTSQSLATLPTGPGSSVAVVKLDSAVRADAFAAAARIKDELGVSRLDVVIANAGVCDDHSPVATMPEDKLVDTINVNALGPIYLFQAVLPLLVKGSKFVTIGSPMGSIGGIEQRPLPAGPYGPSKAMLHWTARKIHQEHKDLISFPLDPGFVQTELGNESAVFFGMEKARLTIEESVKGCIETIDGATREKTSGTFASWNGQTFPW